MCILRCTVFSARMWGLCTLVAALLVLGFDSARAQTAGGHWTVSAVDGTATITSHGGKGFAVSRGQPVGANTTIVTDEDGLHAIGTEARRSEPDEDSRFRNEPLSQGPYHRGRPLEPGTG